MSLQLQRRHFALGSLAALASGALHSVGAEDQPPVQIRGLATLPSVDGQPEVVLYRIILAPGADWSLEYPGPVAVTVESGTMDVPEYIERKLTGRGFGLHPECPDPQINGTTFGCMSGFISESGSFGSLINAGEDDLTIMVLFTKPPDSEMVTPTT